MSNGDNARNVRSTQTPDDFSQRCAALNVPLWTRDKHGEYVEVVPLPNDARGWLDASTITRWVIAASDQNQRGAAAECVPGLFIIPMCETQADVWAVTILWTQDFLSGTDLARYCQAASLNETRVAAALRPQARLSRRDAEQFAVMLQWMFADHAARQRDRFMLDRFSENLVQAYEEINMLFRIARMLNGVSDPLQLMQLICTQLQQTLPFGWVAARFSDLSHDVPQLTGRLVVGGELTMPERLFDAKVRALMSGWAHDDWSRMLIPAHHELARLAGSEIVADPIAHDDKVVGVLLAGNKLNDDSDLSSAETQFVDAMAEFLGVFHENLARFAEQRSLFMGTLRALTASIDAKDAYTHGHSERVALLSGQLALALGLDQMTVEQYRVAGLVHDVGKIGVPETVLQKPSRLTSAEAEQMRRHPQIGFEILKGIPLLEPVLPGVLHHHERYDGDGYPAGLAGDNIPLVARVLALADAFDAMSSTRAYRPARSRAQVCAELQQCTGTQFDPNLVSLFLTLDLAKFDALLQHQRQEAKAA
jgi:HD-GYP domain-containing protein (c-di-GMP phosphodiesterase class II)